MTSNDNNDNVIQMNLASWCRWKALYYKDIGSLSTSLKEEGVYIKTLSNYKRKWIIDGEGTPLAVIDNNVVKAALDLMINDVGELETIKMITSNCNDFKFYADYCYDLQHN